MTEKENYVAVNGSVVLEKDAEISIYDSALHFGDGVYETFFVANGIIMDMATHLNRLLKSCNELALDVDIETSFFEVMSSVLLEKNGLTKGYAAIKVIVSRGDIDISPKKNKSPHYYVITYPVTLEESLYEEGVSLYLKHMEYPAPFAAHKTLNRLVGMRGTAEANEHGFDDALFMYNGLLTQTSSSNIFIYTEGSFHTPAENVLEGTSREAVVFLAGEMGYEVIYKDIVVDELFSSSEVFITSTIDGIVPVKRIGNVRFGVGEITKALIAEYNIKRGVIFS